jgi:hypothetical protein
VGKNKFLFKRFYSFKVNNKKYYLTSSISPEKFYSNSDTHKVQIFQENKGKSGIYR